MEWPVDPVHQLQKNPQTKPNQTKKWFNQTKTHFYFGLCFIPGMLWVFQTHKHATTRCGQREARWKIQNMKQDTDASISGE